MKLERIIILGTFVAFLAALFAIWWVMTPSREEKLQDYFYSSNPNPYLHRINKPNFRRKVSGDLKREIRHRDNDRCLICRSTISLEVDHSIALQNGGSNDPSNLATLCDECHKMKDDYDRVVRAQRDKIRKNPFSADNPDSDNDGIADSEDNEPNRFNPHQLQ